MANDPTPLGPSASALRMPSQKRRFQPVLQGLRAGERLSPSAVSQTGDTLSWMRGSQEEEE